MEVSGRIGVNVREFFKFLVEEVFYENVELREFEGCNNCCILF